MLIRTPAGQALLWVRPADDDAPALVQTMVTLEEACARCRPRVVADELRRAASA